MYSKEITISCHLDKKPPVEFRGKNIGVIADDRYVCFKIGDFNYAIADKPEKRKR
jgi:hypothetical protein